jgi:toxin ParE1/3/4
MRRLRLSPLAKGDIENILFHSHATFAESARLRYEALIEAALHDIAADPDRIGVKQRSELGPNVRTYHLFYSREHGRTKEGIVREPRHMLLFRVIEPDTVDVGRILHDAMEVTNHLPPGYR